MDDQGSFSIDFGDDDSGGFTFRRDAVLIDPPVLKCYLASPLTGNEAFQEECRKIREATKYYLGDYDWLGVTFHVYDPADVTPPGSDHTPEDVYLTDCNSTASADLVFFLATVPSHGVGMEAQIAAQATVPRIIVARRGSTISRMLRGLFAPTIAVIEYDSIDNFVTQLRGLLPDIAAKAIESAERRRAAIAACDLGHFGRTLLKQRIRRGLSRRELALKTDIMEHWLRRMECDATAAGLTSLVQVARLADALGCLFVMEQGVGPVTFKENADSPALGPDEAQSLDHLVDFIVARSGDVVDEKIVRIWRDYIDQRTEELQEAGRYRAGNPVVTVDEWRRRYDAVGLF